MTSNVEDELRAAATSGDIDQLTRLIPVSEPLSNETVNALVSAAAWKVNTSIVAFLLAKFPSVPLAEEPVRAAAYSGSIPLFSSLIERDPSIVNMQFDKRGTALITACMSRKPPEFLRFLLEAGADPNQDPDVATYPIGLVAFFYTDLSVVDLLLEYGARIERSGALSAAARSGNESMLRHLLRRGAMFETDDPESGLYEYPVHIAVKKGHIGVLRILLDLGAAGSIVNAKGVTAIKAAEEMEEKGQDMSEILALLKRDEIQSAGSWL